MEPIYEWLYDHYAYPRLRELPIFRDARIREALAAPTELDQLDQLATLQLESCTAALELGVRLGIELTAPARSSAPPHPPGIRR